MNLDMIINKKQPLQTKYKNQNETKQRKEKTKQVKFNYASDALFV